MEHSNQSSAYLSKSISSIVILAIYWGVVYFICKSIFKGNFSTEHIIGTIEIVSALAIIITIIILVSKILGNIFIGIIVATILLIAGCSFGEQYMTAYNLSDSIIENIFFGIGILLNIGMIIRFTLGIRNYKLFRYVETHDMSNSNETNISE